MKKLLALVALLTIPLIANGADMSHGADNFYTSDRLTKERSPSITSIG
ncbi:MAG TPA: hypothetical protein VLF15_12955 [Pseudoxanthomonas sp.]|nr:hypothetical protein [Pseudoxanthomonas sp.]